MEEQECGDDSKEGEQEIKYYKHRKPPDKRRQQMEKDYLSNLIQEKEAIYKSLNVSRVDKSSLRIGNREELLSKLRILKEEKESRMKRKQVIDAELKGLSQQLQKKTEKCAKLQANLRYKDDQRINDAIKRLEKHLSTHQLKLAEEKKLVCEIDSLRRSKKTLSEFLFAKQEVDQLRHHQKKLRDERNNLIRETHGIKAREKEVKTSLDNVKTEGKEEDSENKELTHDKESLKKEINSLYEKRRELIAQHKQEMATYYEGLKKPERNLMKTKAEEKREEMRMLKIIPERRRQQSRPKIHPHEEEMNICVCLIQYLEPLRVQSSTDLDEDKPAGHAKYLEVPRSEFSKAEESQEGSFVMKKSNENLDGLFAVSSRRMTRKGSKKGRKSKDSCQKLVLHPHVFEQFFKLDLEPPSTSADVNRVLEQLRGKKEFYEHSVNECNTQLSLFPENSGATTLEKPNLHMSGEELPPDAGLSVENDTEEKIRDAEGPDKKCLRKSSCQTSEVFGQAQEVESGGPGVEYVDPRSTEIKQTSGISRTTEDNPESKVQTFARDEQIHVENEQNISRDEKLIFKELRVAEEDEKSLNEKNLNKEEFTRNKENSKEIINDTSKMCSTVITDTLEKGLDRLGMKESSKEIQVRAT